MADQPTQAQPPKKPEGFFGRMSMFQKILLGLGIAIIVVLSIGIVLGGIKDFYQFFFYLIVIVGVIVGAYVIVKATAMFFQPKFFSPREDILVKLTNMGIDYKPDNLNDLYFVGDVGKKRVLAGKIIGCLGLPYYTGEVMRDEKGDVIYTEVKDFEGKKIPRYGNMKYINDGDTLFIIKKGFFLFAKTHKIRCHRDFHSTLNGDVEIYDINPYPYGSYEYPYKMMQKNTTQIMMQNQIETILATHEHQHDLISQSVDSAIYFNPFMRMQMKQQSELPPDGE